MFIYQSCQGCERASTARDLSSRTRDMNWVRGVLYNVAHMSTVGGPVRTLDLTLRDGDPFRVDRLLQSNKQFSITLHVSGLSTMFEAT